MVNFLAVLLPDGTTAYRIGEILAVWGSLFVIVNFFMFWFWKAKYKGVAAWFAQRHGFRAPAHDPLTIKEAERLVTQIKRELAGVQSSVDKIQANQVPALQQEYINKALDPSVKTNEMGLVILLDEYGLKATISARANHDIIVDFDFDVDNPQNPKRFGYKRRFSLFSNLFSWWGFF